MGFLASWSHQDQCHSRSYEKRIGIAVINDFTSLVVRWVLIPIQNVAFRGRDLRFEFSRVGGIEDYNDENKFKDGRLILNQVELRRAAAKIGPTAELSKNLNSTRKKSSSPTTKR